MKLAKAIIKAKRVYLCGNGGSAANAIHIANDLVAIGVKAQALTADIATLTAIANDFSYEEIFSRQIETFGEPGDLLLALSSSGKSPNIVKAIEAAKAKGMKTFAIIGEFNENTPIESIADRTQKYGTNVQDAEERQLQLGHRVRAYIISGK